MNIFFAAIAAVMVAFLAWRVRALTLAGAVSAAVVGLVHFGIGGSLGACALLAFFVSSSALSRVRRARKAALGFAKSAERDHVQVWANGGVATAAFLLSALLPEGRTLWVTTALGALAAANADTWATEIGSAFGKNPRRITSGRPAAVGESGAISVWGTAAALAGASLIAAVALGFQIPLSRAFAVLLGGFGGALLDSVLGATVQAQWRDKSGHWTEQPQKDAPTRGIASINNDVVNFLATLGGAALAGLIAGP